MRNVETTLTTIGTILAVIAIGRYVYRIFKMPAYERTDFKNLVMPKGSFWNHGNNIMFLLGALLIIIGRFFFN